MLTTVRPSARIMPSDPELPVRDDNFINRTVDRIDDLHRRIPPIAFTFAVLKKFGDDRAGPHCALIAYYGFFSVFPLMLVLVAVVEWVLSGNEELQQDIIDSAVAQIPVIGEQIVENVSELTGSPVVVIVGLVVAIWAGLGAARATQDGLNAVFGVPFLRRANFFLRQLRGLVTLGVFGTLVLVSMVVGSILAGLPGGTFGRIATFVASSLLNSIVIAALFKVLTHRKLTRTEMLVGAVAGGVAWTVLQTVGAFYIDRVVTNATRTYGVFAVVIGLLSWVYLAARITLTAAEAGTVAEKRLWPRAMIRERPTEADLAVADLINDREERLKTTERNYVRVVVAPDEPVAESVDVATEAEQPEPDQPDG